MKSLLEVNRCDGKLTLQDGVHRVIDYKQKLRMLVTIVRAVVMFRLNKNNHFYQT